MKRLFLIIFAILFLSVPAMATDYYVDNTITDCADYDPTTCTCGSGSYQAYDSMDDIETNVAAGAHNIYFRRGQTHTGTGDFEPKAGHTYDAFGTGADPILSFDVTNALDIRSDDTGASYNNLDIRTTTGVVCRIFGSGDFAFNMHGCSLSGVTAGLYVYATAAFSVSLNISGTIFSAETGSALSNVGDVTYSGTIDTSTFVSDSLTAAKFNATVSNLTISNSSATGGLSNWLFDEDINGLTMNNCTAANASSGQGLIFDAGTGVTQQDITIIGGLYHNNGTDTHNGIRLEQSDTGILSNILITGASIYSNANDGISTYGTITGLIIEKNSIYTNGVDGIDGHGDGIALHGTVTAVIRYNKIYNNLKYQIHSIDNCNVTAYNNEIWSDADIAEGNMLWIQDSAVLNFYNNTIVLNVVSPTTGLLLIGSAVTAEQNFYNNIFYGGIYAIDNQSSSSPVLNIDYNNYYNQDTAALNNTSDGGHSITSNPLFIDANNDDYGLSSSSPCLSAGVAINGLHNTGAGQRDIDNNFIAPYKVPIGAHGYERASAGNITSGSM